MKRSTASPTFGGGPPKRFDVMRSPQMQLQSQMHQQIHHLQHQHHHQHPHQQQNQQQHQQHHQHQQQHQQQHYQHNTAVAAAMAANVPFFPNVNTPPPGMQAMNGMNGLNNINNMNPMNGMIPYSSPNPPSNPYHYNPNVGMQARMWKYSMPTTPVTSQLNFDITVQPPLPLVPPQQPPLPPPEPEPPNFTAINTSFPPPSTVIVSTRGNTPIVTEHEGLHPFNNKKPKRKTMSCRAGGSKQWDREDALKAIALENEYSNKAKRKILLLRFPDPDLSRDIVSKYSPQIESVHFQQNAAPRFCFVHLKEDADIEKVTETISQIPFGTGFVKVEPKRAHGSDEAHSVNPEEIDPYTLYVGNLPTTISSRTVKEHFPGAQRIDIGHALRMKYTRYAFVRYHTVEQAMAAFRKCVKDLIESRSPIVRFRRFPCNEQKALQRKESAAGTILPATSVATETRGAATVAATVQQVENNSMTENETISAVEEQQVTTQLHGPLEGPLTASTTFDSPNSLEEPEEIQTMTDSKDKVLQEAEQLKRKMSSSVTTEISATTGTSTAKITSRTTTTSATTATSVTMAMSATTTSSSMIPRRSSIEEMFEELEHRRRELDKNAINAKPTTAVSIKKETEDFDEPSEDEEPLSLLGTRYKENVVGDSQIKTDPDESPIREEESYHILPDEMYQDDFDYDDEYDSEPEETATNVWVKQTMPKTTAVSNSNSATAHPSWDIVRKRELEEDVENKPAIEELNNTLGTDVIKAKSCLPFPFPAHTSDIEKLYEQQRQFKKREESKRPRDDLDDMFARMNSDTEEDEDDFF